MVKFASNDITAIVLDVGSHTTKIGFAGEQVPHAFPTRQPSVFSAPLSNADPFSGGEPGEIGTPFTHLFNFKGDWDAFDAVVRTGFKILGENPGEHPLMLVVPTLVGKKQREQLCEWAFGKLGVPALYLGTLYLRVALTSCCHE